MADEAKDGLSEAWTALKTAFAKFRSRPSEPEPYIGPVTAAPGDPLVSGSEFPAESSYFSVRLVDMHLAEGGKYFTDFLPMGVCVTEYTYGFERRRLPLVLSNESAQKMVGDGQAKVGPVRFADMPVVSHAPVKEANVALFVGLFRMPYSDIAKSVLQLAADVSEELGATPFAAQVKIASKLYDRVSGLFGMKGVAPRFAYLDGMALRKSGYLLIAGPLPNTVNPEEFIVKNSKLALEDGASTKPEALDGLDYCLIAIQQHDNRFKDTAELRQLAALPFHARWQAVTKLMSEKKVEEADTAFLALRGEIATSPDLTEDDRLNAISGYDAGYTKWSEKLLAKPGGGPATRAARSDTPVIALNAVAQNSDKGTAAALKAITQFLQAKAPDLQVKAPDLQPKTPAERVKFDQDQADAFLVDAFAALREPLAKARKEGAKAADLANAIAVGTSKLS